jgi:hypothetical protein
MNRNDEDIKTNPAPVAATPQRAGEAPARRDPWGWGGTSRLDRSQVDAAHVE